MGEQPQDNRNRYLAPKALFGAAVIDLGALAIANLATDVSDKFNTAMLTMGGGLVVTASIAAAITASTINRK